MRTALHVIRDEHRSIGAVLKALTKQVGEAAAGTAPADYSLYGAMLDYLQAFPETLHHPKEDQFLFHRLRVRCPQSADLLDELEAQHASGAKALASLRTALAEAVRSGDIHPFAAALGTYADFQWSHMRKEEEQVLPLAERELSAEDWAFIDAAFAVNRETRW
jgi:branched-chain amino acid transport system ATP-binding protein